MNFDIGYHVVGEEALDVGDEFDERMSVVEFLRRVDDMGDLPYDIAVFGLDSYLRGAEDPEEISEFIHDILSERVNFLLANNPRVQFVVDNVEYWDEPVLLDGDERIGLNRIFRGSLEQVGPGWYSSNLNVTS
ncbi:hypothetical protein [Natrarchaeobaculum sulfurireducens]|uniref:DUF8076 domain-containing protein n=1 Tax=Natrarchaeobaculum sulfurireducens TaxID=2044521 RepID=A0A346P9I0_9EURY|nr:hypothetical protein [Natrarchaeobaculum sulfurireducens]AXR76175.1 hypothetical protein AArc1_4058 [Natrarchaeobaculum sulfurireducens]